MDEHQLENVDLSEAIGTIAEGEIYAGSAQEIVFLDELSNIAAIESKIICLEDGAKKLKALKEPQISPMACYWHSCRSKHSLLLY